MAVSSDLARVKRVCKIALDNVKARNRRHNGVIPEDTGALKRSLKFAPVNSINDMRIYIDGRFVNPRTHQRVRDYYKYINPIDNPNSKHTNPRNTDWWDTTAMEIMLEMARLLNGTLRKV